MMFTKFVVVVDEHVDVHDPREVAWRVFNNVDPRRDTMIVDGPLDVLDHSSPTAGYGAKMGIDATRTWPDEGHGREWPDELAMDPAVDGARRRVAGPNWVSGFGARDRDLDSQPPPVGAFRANSRASRQRARPSLH